MKRNIERIAWIALTGILIGSIISIKINRHYESSLTHQETVVSQKFENQGFNFKAQSDLLGYYQFLNTAIEYLKHYYVHSNSLELNKLFLSAVDGLYKGVGDPYTTVLSPSFYQEISQDIQGKIGGIGLYLESENNRVVVLSILKSSPAFNKGLKIRDIILSINGKAADHDNLDKTAEMIQGPVGSSIKLEIFRESTHQHFTIILKRSNIKIDSVYSTFLPHQIGYLKIMHFAETTPLEVKTALKFFVKNGLRSLIIDLRYNPGGSFPAVINIANMFLPKQLLVYTKGPNQEDNAYYYAKPSNLILPTKTNIVVLVNESSASAAEILAGTLKDNHRAVLIGQKTFGKGSVQSVFPLKLNGQELGFKITVANYYTPGGYIISGKGINPNIIVNQMAVSPVDDTKIQQIVKSDLISNFLKNIPHLVLTPQDYIHLKEILQSKNYAIPDPILKKIIFEQRNILQGKLNFVDLTSDFQLRKAFYMLSPHA